MCLRYQITHIGKVRVCTLTTLNGESSNMCVMARVLRLSKMKNILTERFGSAAEIAHSVRAVALCCCPSECDTGDG